jgi:glycosyltransferase involved in cell wall biosynthesis
MEMTKILVVSHDTIASKMAGPGIRYLEMARVLSQHFPVTLAAPSPVDLEIPGVKTHPYLPGRMQTMDTLVHKADVVIIPGPLWKHFPNFQAIEKPLVVDLYNPFTLENLERHANQPMDDQLACYEAVLGEFNHQLGVGDFFICATERQRDFYLGLLQASGRLNPLTYGDDRSLRRLIDVVPSGLPSELPYHERPVLKGVKPGIVQEDKIVLFWGGLWDWLDQVTPIKAIEELAPRRTEVKLVFPWVAHPDEAHVPVMESQLEAIQLSKDLGLWNKHVFFVDWVPYQKRQNYLLEADIGLSCHGDSLEARFSFRTRFLDYMWAQVPIIATKGDVMSEMVEQHNLGITVRPKDPHQLADAILNLIDDQSRNHACRDHLAHLCPSFTWDKVVRPLVQFCQDPYRSPDGHLPVQTANSILIKYLRARLGAQERELIALRDLVRGYERGRFMRFMAKVQSAKNRFLDKGS